MLRQFAERRYPDVEIVEEWNQEDEPPAPAIDEYLPLFVKLLAVAEAAQAYVDICVNPGHGTTELLALGKALDELKGEPL